jgi:phenylpropionate dioxygenase-like ring-hydroxylating dioxygenase large terminal subunit
MTSPFLGFANVWTPVAHSPDLRAGSPLGVRVAGTGVVLWRQLDGTPAALLDRCPHRGAALSLGRVVGACLQCPFHGWRFDGAGNVTSVPWNPDAKLGALRAQGVPARELAGQIWIRTSLGEAPDEPQINDLLTDRNIRVSGFGIEWRVHWTRAMENMLDWPHLPFVHRRTIGRGLAKLADRRMDITVEEQPWGFHTTIAVDGDPQRGALDFRWPNVMNLYIPLSGRKLLLAVSCVPIDATRTLLLLTTARSFLRHRWLDVVFNRMNRRIAAEDRAIVESSEPSEIPDARLEKSVRTDAPTLRFRRLYEQRLKPPQPGAVGD